MAISDAYRRGYRRAVQDAASLAFSRKIVCEEARDKYKTEQPDNEYYSASENCAAREAGYIWENILQLKPRPDR